MARDLARRWRRGIIVVVALSGVSLESTRAVAQTTSAPIQRRSARWGLIDAMGYGGLGTLVGVLVALSSPSQTIEPDNSDVASIGVGALLGVAIGAAIGANASSAIHDGKPVGDVHGGAVRLGSMLAGATAGALVSVPIISGSAVQADEAVFGALTIGGALLGGIYASRHREELESYRMSIAPVHAPVSGYGLRVAVRF